MTEDGRRFAVFYTKLGDRVLPALFAADQPNAPPNIRHALKVIDGCIDGYTQDACLPPPETCHNVKEPGNRGAYAGSETSLGTGGPFGAVLACFADGSWGG